jgi:cytochrome c biogenesis protein CcdA
MLVIAGVLDAVLIGSGLSAISPRQALLLLAGTSLLVLAGKRALPAEAGAGARLGAVVALGILAVFGLLGLPLYGILRILDFRTQTYVVFAVAAAMVGIGVAGLAGKDLSFALPIRAPRGRRTASFALFGIGYGLVSMGCNLPLFLAAALGPLLVRADVVEGVLALLAYGAGMSLLMIALTVSLALSRGLTRERVRALVPRIKTLGNVVMILAGAYIAYYDWTVLSLAG